MLSFARRNSTGILTDVNNHPVETTGSPTWTIGPVVKNTDWNSLRRTVSVAIQRKR
jgi:hypothetical protein